MSSSSLRTRRVVRLDLLFLPSPFSLCLPDLIQHVVERGEPDVLPVLRPKHSVGALSVNASFIPNSCLGREPARP